MVEHSITVDLDTAELGVSEVLRGAALFAKNTEKKFRLSLVSSSPEDARALAHRRLIPICQSKGIQVEIYEAKDKLPERIESPVSVYRSQPENSVAVGLKILKEKGGAFVSAAHTGLVMTTALFVLGRVESVERPPISTPLPTRGKTLFLLDAGANVDVRAHHLHEFAHLGKVYVETIFGRLNPKIALLSNGTEEYKGNAVVREAYQLLKADAQLNFVGYVEGQELFSGELDIAICDGFIGNILLKVAEGIAGTIYRIMREELRKRPLSALLSKLLLSSPLRGIRKRLDYAELGGAPLLGVKGNVVICHGRSNANAFMNALNFALRMAEANVSAKLEKEMSRVRELLPNRQ